MSQTVIRVEGLSKKFYIGARQEPYQTLREALVRSVAAPLRRVAAVWRGRSTDASENEIWALKDVSFQVRAGETVGIIGRNGAGKSTLLKVLTRITEPTEGELGLNGRVGSLLEVGTGFHPELTGRENVYLNGAILGMHKTEIDGKFDEIVEFAEVSKFLDTPVKHYSSGMYMRLAFAVAAHLEPEILIVDEVLAVGDAAFQKKCLNRMKNVAQHGHTVLFVSHNMQAITQLCSRAILLDAGRVIQDGPAPQVVSSYLNPEAGTSAVREWPDLAEAPGDDVARLCAVRVGGLDGEIADSFDVRLPIAVELEYEVLKPGHVFHPHFALTNQDGVTLFVAQDVDKTWRGRTRPLGRYISTALIPGNFLAEGRVYVDPAMCSLNPNTLHFYEPGVVAFNVVDCFLANDTARGDYPTPVPGVVRPLLEWTTQFWPNGHEASVAWSAPQTKTQG